MKLINVVVFYVLYLLILGSLVSGGVAYGKLYKKCETEKQKYECIRFVSESFRKTCDGSGFSNLNEWQKVCKAFWNLEYIGWAPTTEFLSDVDNKDSNVNYENVMYGKWISDFCEGEVYSKVNSNLFSYL